jgi:hypothetical protein
MLLDQAYPLDTNASLAANYTGNSFPISGMNYGGLQAVWTGSPQGTLAIQVSNDNSNWSTSSASQISISGSGNYAWSVAPIGFGFVRIFYTYTMGTGTLNTNLWGRR